MISFWEALRKLKGGNARFVADQADGKLDSSLRRKQFIGNQQPYAAILSCADSRVVPEFIFDSKLGELFVVRIAGNVANSTSIASLEFAVLELGVNLIVVMGHQNCGAVEAAMRDEVPGFHLKHLVEHIKPVIDASDVKDLNSIVRQNAKYTAQELYNSSEILRNKCLEQKIMIAPAYYRFNTGHVDFLQVEDIK